MDGWFGTSDPFLRFFKHHHNEDWLLVHETEFVQDDENPIWRGFEIVRDKLYGDNPLQPFKIELWDNEKNGKHQFIGAIEITIDQIFIKEQMQFEVKTVKGEFGGHIGIKSLIKPTFIDYLKGGEQINLSIAIDYTGSNGNPKFSDSLHYNHPPDLNQQSKIFYFNILKCFITGLGNNTIEQFYRIISKQHTYANTLNHIMSLVPAIFVPNLEQAISMWEKIKKDIYEVQIILIEGQNDDVQIERTSYTITIIFSIVGKGLPDLE